MDNKSDDRKKLESWYNNGAYNASLNLNFGRKMPFGKYKGNTVYILLVKHPKYMGWILENTDFHLNENGKWLKDKVDTALACVRVNNLVFGLRSQMRLGGVDNIENPHWIVE